MRKSALPRSVILTWELLLFIRELKLKNKNIFCLLTIVSDSDIIIKLNNSVHTLGCRQVVRQRTLTPLFRGFKSFHPNQQSSRNCVSFFVFSEMIKPPDQQDRGLSCLLWYSLLHIWVRQLLCIMCLVIAPFPTRNMVPYRSNNVLSMHRILQVNH